MESHRKMTRARSLLIALVGIGFLLTAEIARAQDSEAISPYDPAQDPNLLELTIVHFNDLRRIEDVKGRGGLGRVAAVVAAERASKAHVLVTHGGNAISPSLFSTLDNGAHMIDVLNHVGIDVMGMGASEFDFGPSVASALFKNAEFPVLATNVVGPGGERLEGTRETLILEYGSFRVGIFSLMQPTADRISLPGRFKPQSPLEVARITAERLRKEGADFVIALTALLFNDELRLVRSGYVDLVLGADQPAATAFFDGTTAFAESSAEGAQLTLVDVQLRRVDIEIGGRASQIVEGDEAFITEIEPSTIETRVVPTFGFRIVDTADVWDEESVHRLVQRQLLRLSDELQDKLVTLPVSLDSRQPLVQRDDISFGHLVADAARRSTGADLALIESGNFRGNRFYDAGQDLTGLDLLNEFPFQPHLLVLGMTGEDVLEALEHGLADLEEDRFKFPVISGMVVVVDRDQPPGRRVESVTTDSGPLQPEKRYSVAVTNWIAGGGLGYAMLPGQARIVGEASAQPVFGVIVDYLKDPPASLERDLGDDRIVFKGG